MPQQTITIRRKGSITDEIEADVEGPFAIHETVFTPHTRDTGFWTLTHIPTGYVIVICEFRSQCIAARAELLAAGGDWSSADPKVIGTRHRTIGRRIKQTYERLT